MKFLLTATTLILLAGCAGTLHSTNSDTANAAMPEAIKAFNDVCLKTAPTFSNAEKVAASYGMSDLLDLGFTKTGFNKDQSLGVQIKENKECVITTPSQQSKILTKTFLKIVEQYSSTPVSKTVPTKATINGKIFIFMHDRNGGEAYVMLNPND